MNETTNQEKLKKALNEVLEKSKEIQEYEVKIVGVSEEQAHYINEIFTLIDNHTLNKLNADLKILDSAILELEEPLKLYKEVLLLIDKKYLNNHIYKKVESTIKDLEKRLKPIKANRKNYTKLIEETKTIADKMWSHIDIEVDDENKISTWNYDKFYFEPILDVAYLLLPLTSYETNKNKEIK